MEGIVVKYSNNHKKVIGIIGCALIELRKDNESNYSTIPDRIYDDKGNFLCSRRTWRRAATGIPTLQDNLYDYLITKSNYNFVTNSHLDDMILDKLHDILGAVNVGDELLMIEPCATLIDILETCKDVFYYREIYLAAIDLQECYVNSGYIQRESFEWYMRILKSFPNELQALLVNVMYQYATNVIGKIKMIEAVVNMYDFKYSYDFLRIKYVQLMMFQGRHIEAYQKFTELENSLQHTNNYVLLVEVCSLKANLVNAASVDEIMLLENKVIDIAEKYMSLFTNRRLSSIYYMQGMRCFHRQQYLEAIDFLQKSLDLGNKSRERECNIYLVYLRKMQNLSCSLIHFDESLNYSDKTPVSLSYKYFVMQKQSFEYEYLAQFILYDILQVLQREDLFYIEVFTFEMTKLVEVLHQYKFMSEFTKKIAQIRQKR